MNAQDIKEFRHEVKNLQETAAEFADKFTGKTDEQVRAMITKQRAMIDDLEWAIAGAEAELTLRQLTAALTR